MAAGVNAEEYPFGRLFTAPLERLQLDKLRQGIPSEAETPVPKAVVKSVDESTTQLQFSGYVLRADGTSVIWVDGKSDLTRSGEEPEIGRLLPDSRKAQFKSPYGEATLKPGQTWHIEQDLITDAYEPAPVVENVEPASP